MLEGPNKNLHLSIHFRLPGRASVMNTWRFVSGRKKSDRKKRIWREMFQLCWRWSWGLELLGGCWALNAMKYGRVVPNRICGDGVALAGDGCLLGSPIAVQLRHGRPCLAMPMLLAMWKLLALLMPWPECSSDLGEGCDRVGCADRH